MSGHLTENEAREYWNAPESRVVELEQALEKAIEVIEWCGLNDRSKPYDYGESRPNGDKPRVGAVFNTPREFASWWPDRLRDVLTTEAALKRPTPISDSRSSGCPPPEEETT